MNTNEILLTFENTNHSIKAEQALLAQNLHPTVMPLPGSIRAGCGLSLRVSLAEYPMAVAVLQAANLPTQAYLRHVEGINSVYTPYATIGEG